MLQLLSSVQLFIEAAPDGIMKDIKPSAP